MSGFRTQNLASMPFKDQWLLCLQRVVRARIQSAATITSCKLDAFYCQAPRWKNARGRADMPAFSLAARQRDAAIGSGARGNLGRGRWMATRSACADSLRCVVVAYVDRLRAAVLATFTSGSGRSDQPVARISADPRRATSVRDATAASDRRIHHHVVDHQVRRCARTAGKPEYEQLTRSFGIGSRSTWVLVIARSTRSHSDPPDADRSVLDAPADRYASAH